MGGLTESSTNALKRWMIEGSEFTTLISEFESLYLPELNPELNYIDTTKKDFRHRDLLRNKLPSGTIMVTPS